MQAAGAHVCITVFHTTCHNAMRAAGVHVHVTLPSYAQGRMQQARILSPQTITTAAIEHGLCG